jgi:dTDP-4-amino-4,6-dideoxygalactose transaminase
LLYDAAHAFGCSYAGRSVAGLGDAAVLSFHATKVFHTSEGGAVCTNDDDLASRIRLMRNFGFQGFDKVVCLGTNGKMTEIIAAMGLTNLEVIDGFLAVNRRNYDAYAAGLGGIPGVKPIVHDPRERNNYQYVVVEFDGKEFGVSRDALCRLLHAENVIARRYFYPGCHRMEPYRTLMPDAGQGLPHTEALCERVLVFPTGTQTTPAEIAAVCGFVGGVHRLAAEDRLPADLHAAANLGDGGTALKA